MTREELTKKLDNLSQEIYALGLYCTALRADPILRALGEVLKNTSFTMDTFFDILESVEE